MRRCSTPSGIKGRNASRGPPADPAFRRHAQRLPASKEETRAMNSRTIFNNPYAQRLPASKEETHIQGDTVIQQIDGCSTPSGIKGRNASINCGCPFQGRNMLNAFRHQRKKRTPATGTCCSNCSNAQRLPASKEETRERSGRPRRAACDAQRLPASKEETPPVPRGSRLRSWMLNAFRHQRKKRRLRPSIMAAWADAQRLPASKEETQASRAT